MNVIHVFRISTWICL